MHVPLGSSTIEVTIDAEVTTATPQGGTPIDVRAAAEAAMESPHGQALADRLSPSASVGIVVTDVTRETPTETLLDVLMRWLSRAGIDRDQVTIVIGLGLHRPLTDAEIRDELGGYADIAVNHDPAEVVEVGSVDGCPITLFEPLADVDCLCSTGLVEPHQYAGFSGGAKTAVIGAGGESQIRYTHGPALLGQPGVRLGRIDDNPFRGFLDAAADEIGLEFCINVTRTPAGVIDVAAGDPRAVVETLAETARSALAVAVDESYDAVLAGVGAPKDSTLYQASRAATYIGLGARNPLTPGGQIVIPARLSEGAGQGTGERRFHEWLADADDPASLVEAMRTGYEPGAQRAFVLAQVLRDHPVAITNSSCPDLVEDCLMTAHDTPESALEGAQRVLVVPDALHTLLV